MRHFQQQIGGRRRQRLAPDLAGVDRVEAPAEIAADRLVDLAGVHRRPVGRHRQDHIVGAEPVIAGRLDRREHIAQRGQSEVGQARDQSGVDAAPLDQVLAPLVGVEQGQQLVGMQVADRGDHVGVHHVVDVGHVLVADALDVVFAEAVVEQRRTLGGLDGDDARAEFFLEVIAGRQRAARTGCGNVGREFGARASLGE